MKGKTSTAKSMQAALRSWRIGAVTLLSFSSGMPLGFLLTAIPAWMAMRGVDIKTIGVITLAQAPYAFKFLWAPVFDRFSPKGLGRKRGWIFLWQGALALLTLLLAWQATSPQVGVVAALTVLIAFASASQDIAVDGYTVDSLKPEEQGLAVGARSASYRVGMLLAGAISISVAAAHIAGKEIGWGLTIAMLALLYVALMPVTYFAPEPSLGACAPRTMREAVWEPFVGFFQKPRALEIAAFLLLYKLANNLAVSLVRPFFVQKGFDPIDIGLASGTVGLVFTMLGTMAGGILTPRLGVGRALWLFGFLQAFAGLGYAVVAQVPLNRPLMYGSMAMEAVVSGMGTGAFGVLLMRLTQKRFSATQYALFSSVFALGRTIAGPIAGVVADAVGWRDFFIFTVVCSVPGLVMLQRFVPWGTRDLVAASIEDPVGGERVRPLTRGELVIRGFFGAILGTLSGLLATATLAALKNARQLNQFDFLGPLLRIIRPRHPEDYLQAVGVLAFGLMVGLGIAAYLAARRSLAGSNAGTEVDVSR